MTWPASAPEPSPPEPEPEALREYQGADGSFSLWSQSVGEGFHSGRGALREARETFLAPSQLERFAPGARLKVVEVAVGTGTNLALLLEACAAQSLQLEWWGLELDPRPLQLALAADSFRRPWQPATLQALEQLLLHGRWRGQGATCQLLWGDARSTLQGLLGEQRGQIDGDCLEILLACRDQRLAIAAAYGEVGGGENVQPNSDMRSNPTASSE